MGSFKNLTLVLLLYFSYLAASHEDQRIQFLIATKDFTKAIDYYLKFYETTKTHQPELLRSLSKGLIDCSFSSTDSKEQLLALYGLMISNDHDLDYDYTKLLDSKDPYVQLLTIQYLSNWNEDIVDVWLNKAMSSPFLPVRMQALGNLVQRKSKLALSHIESLYYRLPEFIRPVFAQFYASLGTPQAIKILKQMLSNPSSEMKVASLLASCQFQRDDLKEEIRKILTQSDPMVQETAVYAASFFKDLNSLESIEKLTNSPHQNVKLAALMGLSQFKKDEKRQEIFDLAKKKDLSSIFYLGVMDGSEQILLELISDDDFNVRLNTLFSLLEKKHPKSKDLLIQFFKFHSNYDGLAPNFSAGKTQQYIKMYPAYTTQFKKSKEFIAYLQGMTLMIRNQLLIQALELNEVDFLEIAQVIFENDIYDVIPTLVRLLENCPGEKTLDLLKKMSQKTGSPRTRIYCLMALARLKDPYFTPLFFEFIENQKNLAILQINAFDTQDTSIKKSSRFFLNPDEQSQAILESYETLIYLHDEKCFSILLKALLNSPMQNRAVLAGLLLKALL